MHVVYTLQDAPEALTSSIFLAGPTPRGPDTPSWRPEALKTLEELGYDGVVFVPEYETGWAESYEYSEQVAWEEKYLNMADAIVFWVPRDIEGGLPAFTTNIEWGKWQASGKCVLGFPEGADKVRYLEDDANRLGIPLSHDLQHTLGAAVGRLGGGDERTGGEREVPLHIWRTGHFQSWYKNQTAAGNRLNGAKLLWDFKVGPQKAFVFAFVLHVNVYVAAEDRNKTNEFLVSRTDISTIVAYQTGQAVGFGSHFLGTEIALIREFRSPANTYDGFIREVPGGSSVKQGQDPMQVMADELWEETGLTIDDPSRFRFVGQRQLAGTLSTHLAHVYAIEITDEEMAYLKQQETDNIVHGNIEDSERTYVEIRTIGDLLSTGDVDWSMIGMILTARLT